MVHPIPPIVMPTAPATNITPFTYRDGLSYLQRLERIVKYINNVVKPYIDKSYGELAEAFEEQVNALIIQVNTLVEQIIDDSIELQDPVMAGILADIESESRILLNTLYAPINIVDTVNENTADIAELNTVYAPINIVDTVNENTADIADLKTIEPYFKTWYIIEDGKDGIDLSAADNGPALQSIVNALPAQATLQLSRDGVVNIQTPVTIDKTLKVMGNGQTRYHGGTFRVNVSAGTAFIVKAGQTHWEDVSIVGDGGGLGVGATTTAIDFYGTNLGDVDALVRGGNYSGHLTAIRNRGRNINIDGAIISNSRNGLHCIGMDDGVGGWHESAASKLVRGIRVTGKTRFHGIGDGTNSTDAMIKIDNQTECRGIQIENFLSDAAPHAEGIRIIGSAIAPIQDVCITDTMFTDHRGRSVVLQYVNDFAINGVYHYGAAGEIKNTTGMSIVNCNHGIINNVTIERCGADGLALQASTTINIGTIKIANAGVVQEGDGMQISSDCSLILLNTLLTTGCTGYGFRGSPTNSKWVTSLADANTLGTNSGTLTPIN